MNLPLILTGLTGSALLVYVGITDPPGGIPGVLTGVLSGTGVPKKISAAYTGGGSITAAVAASLGSPGGAAGAQATAYTTNGTDPRVPTVIKAAESQIGVPYRFGGTGPASGGWDCSSLVQAAYAAVGVKLPRTTYQQVFIGSHVSRANLLPGDLVFPDPGHVQLYIGNGQIVEAPHTGLNVRISTLGAVWAARRILAAPAASHASTVVAA